MEAPCGSESDGHGGGSLTVMGCAASYFSSSLPLFFCFFIWAMWVDIAAGLVLVIGQIEAIYLGCWG